MKVTVRLLSGADHLSQILTGFQMLSRENKLTLDILDCRKDSPVYQEAFLEAQVNGIRILFDLMDGYWYNRPETVFPLYHSADIVFKSVFNGNCIILYFHGIISHDKSSYTKKEYK